MPDAWVFCLHFYNARSIAMDAIIGHILTVRQATSASYEQMPDFYVHPLGLDRLEAMMDSIDRKRYEILLSGEDPQKYDLILRYSFVIVAHDFGYCLWRRTIMSDIKSA